MSEKTDVNVQMSQDTSEHLTFTLGDETYALDILKVKEIRGYETVTKIARAPDFIKGVINLRGEIVPILDLRIKFDVGKATYDEFTIVIVLHVHERYVGIVVDSVSDVMSLREEDIRPSPDFGVAFDSRFLKGLAESNDQMVILVDIERLITSDEAALADQQTSNISEHS